MLAIQTVAVQSRDSPKATANLLNSKVNSAKMKNQDGTEIGELPRSPMVINELTNKLRTRKPETNPYRAASFTP